ncbi:Asp-tRNA(Asn)/Glu-tRNA(Gln) amidotransferase subunit GatB [Wolbachia endosymbiont of Diaphorina citri]|jgi:aspartyl/glutamyl-tRNA(Asn/Gln) amidotransferase, B subunit|uniref:Asp-tRNA(Asn)/Glu-tRNA(Gln) amidotransferase subunit GatB n=1 Tax=Wolbachia endosymbiont of Diaphorina citri TaxID=116598 RepID=UPI00030E3D49|nr:Asp-tRNA(Asn)/Glu-tRNA(Gln) amidotransferase subunit GatB [Wolbachia endosymbiont of Diaphorina citri]QJT94968.1 Asp-tRNA(Asn)/Glu-tRNA(Gln) amidotransferase subunit GatB [Wolbachia endosymbiont of Diaphorina citri]QJT96069.1 Asp-tRNA(Asn)/Glu-tRNA(Gln) amidotransferase subunit GatB [Wolbachia endosymbiont of Diaphorina citri]QJT97431.1 Asp-tRNA(Asn)/Glu-tRNA(Gln) amidotransferase subunit GatB [Wolbachia endosymbiont of Diaphorina citri]QLK11917.1 Asp-tRNA(Asn)/Glu-tRNA(Gln) amidotransferase
MTKENWETVIGLEVHAQVSSKTKLFSSSLTEFGTEHNTQVSLVDAAMPGTLPILNYFCIEQAICTGFALSAEINKCSYFDRKNYFYPDLPQGYQITQFFEPIVKNGKVFINNNEKEIRIARIHLEQDAGKSIHEESKTYVDLNRAGVALMEIVSEPDLRSSAEAAEFMKKLRQILRYIGSCDGDMEKGSLRCDANVSVRPKGSSTFGTRCEIKNLNSIRYIVQAIDYEAQRQIKILESGGEISQDTLLFDVTLGKTKVMRSKEDSSDYRYFPEPDLLPVEISQDKIDSIKSSLPELPDQKKLRYIEELGINEYDADVITSDKEIADYFEKLAKKHDSKIAVTWLTVELFGRLNKTNIDIVSSPIKADALSELLDFIVDGTISAKLGKQVFDIMFETGKPASLIIEEQNLKQITDTCQISEVIDKIINDNQDKVQEYKGGKTRLYRFFVGEVMKSTKGKASPDVVNLVLSEKLKLSA